MTERVSGREGGTGDELDAQISAAASAAGYAAAEPQPGFQEEPDAFEGSPGGDFDGDIEARADEILKAEKTVDPKDRIALHLRSPLSAYLDQINQHPKLKGSEEAELAQTIERGRVAGGFLALREILKPSEPDLVVDKEAIIEQLQKGLLRRAEVLAKSRQPKTSGPPKELAIKNLKRPRSFAEQPKPEQTGSKRNLDFEPPVETVEGREETIQRFIARAAAFNDEEVEMLRGLVQEGERAFKRFVEANLRLVVAVAWERNYPNLTRMDLILGGNDGLIRAVEKFDYAPGTKFGSYAVWWIRDAINRTATAAYTIRLPVNVVNCLRQIRRAQGVLGPMLGRPPTSEEIAAEIEKIGGKIKPTHEKVTEVLSLAAMQPRSLNAPIEGAEHAATLEDIIAGIPVVEIDDEAQRDREIVDLSLDILRSNGVQMDIVRRRCGFPPYDGPQTFEEIAKVYELTREAIRQRFILFLSQVRASPKFRELLSMPEHSVGEQGQPPTELTEQAVIDPPAPRRVRAARPAGEAVLAKDASGGLKEGVVDADARIDRHLRDPVAAYFDAATREPLLTADEEARLARIMERGWLAGAVLMLRRPQTRKEAVLQLDDALMRRAKTLARQRSSKSKAKESSEPDGDPLEISASEERSEEQLEAEPVAEEPSSTDKQEEEVLFEWEVETEEGRIATIEAWCMRAMLLTRPEISRLRRLAAEADKAFDKFICANLFLVVSNARRYNRSDVPPLDIIQYGNLGLIRAVEKFDYRRGKLSTYATSWIFQMIIEGIAQHDRQIRLPANVLVEINRLRRARSDLQQAYGREPTHEEIAKEVGRGMTPKKVAKLLKVESNDPASFSAPIGDGTTVLEDMIVDEDEQSHLFEIMERLEAVNGVDAFMDRGGVLTERQAKVLKMLFGLPPYGRCYTREEIAADMGISVQSVGELKRNAIEAIKRSPVMRRLAGVHRKDR